MKNFKVYLAGYYGKSLDQLGELRDNLEAAIVDIRAHPENAANHWFREANLKRCFNTRFAQNYIAIKEWGEKYPFNENWKVHDFRRGLIPFLSFMDKRNNSGERNDPVILLCACMHSEDCHRSLLAEMLAKEGYEVETIRYEDWAKFNHQEIMPHAD